jgi:hypothetical protein
VAAIESSGREGWLIGVQARDLGQAHELGAYRRSYGAVRHRVQGGWGIFLIMFAVLGVASAAAGVRGEARDVVLGVAGVLIAVGVVLVKTAPRDKVDWVFLYAGGMAQIIAGAPPRLLPWSRLGHVLTEFDATGEGDPRLKTVRVTGSDGTVITIDDGYHGIGQLGGDIGEVVARLRLPAAVEQCDGGAPVLFGGLSVSRDGLAWSGGAEYAAWRDIRSVRVSPHEVGLGSGARRAIYLGGVPDACVAVALIQELAARHGAQLEGGLAAAPLPAAQRDTPAGSAVLSEAEVSEVLGWPMQALASPGTGLTARFQGEGVTVSLKLRKSVALDRVLPRCLGRALPGAGEQAWLLRGDHTLVARVGPATVQLTVADLPPAARAAALIPLARIVADRIAVSPSQ